MFKRLFPLLLIGVALLWGAAQATALTETDRLLERLIQERQPGYVFDRANVIDRDDERVIAEMLRRLESLTTCQVKVVALPDLADGEIRDFANRLFEGWGIGQKDRDNGLLILMAAKERRIWIEVGYGLEAYLPDAKAGRLLDEYVIPRFKQGEFSEGLKQGTLATADILAKAYNVDLDARAVPAPKRIHSRGGRFRILDLLVVIAVIYIAIRHPILFLLFMGSGGIGGSRGGFGGGGFSGGGFGGGLSGGGGAGRGW